MRALCCVNSNRSPLRSRYRISRPSRFFSGSESTTFEGGTCLSSQRAPMLWRWRPACTPVWRTRQLACEPDVPQIPSPDGCLRPAGKTRIHRPVVPLCPQMTVVGKLIEVQHLRLVITRQSRAGVVRTARFVENRIQFRTGHMCFVEPALGVHVAAQLNVRIAGVIAVLA